MIPVVTMMGLQFGFLLGVPSWWRKFSTGPDLDAYSLTRRNARLPGDSGGNSAFLAGIILINLVVDVLYAAINPAIRSSKDATI